MDRYDQIVVGAGTSGMSIAALLGLNGKRVLLLEKGPRVGGSMLRFKRRGIPFDTGVHFSAGLGDDGILTQMLRVLGVDGAVPMESIEDPNDNRFVFENSGNTYAQPVGLREITEAMAGYFPREQDGIRRYFAMMEEVIRNTASMNLSSITATNVPMKTDDVTLAEVLDELVSDPELKTLLAGYVLCYGTPPADITFTKHSQVAYGLYDSVAFVGGGGKSLVDAFSSVISGLDVEVRTRTSIDHCEDVQARRVKRFVLTTGETVEADECVFTTHPQDVLRALPQDKLHKAFMDRVGAFEPSIGLFCVYAVVRDDEGIRPFAPAIVTRLPGPGMHALLRPDGAADRPMAMLKHREIVKGEPINVLAVQEVSTAADVAEWTDSSTGRRPASYCAYKQEKTGRLMERVVKEFPEYEGRLEVLDSASMLTFRDYLHSPWGCAYGIKQQAGQFSLFGRLPIRNVYVAGQSSALPGVVGAMMSSFIVARMMLGKDAYQPFIDERLGVARTTVEVRA